MNDQIGEDEVPTWRAILDVIAKLKNSKSPILSSYCSGIHRNRLNNGLVPGDIKTNKYLPRPQSEAILCPIIVTCKNYKVLAKLIRKRIVGMGDFF